MKAMWKFFGAVIFILIMSVSCSATTIMDQIGSNPADVISGYASQDFESNFDPLDIAAIDDFYTSWTNTILTRVDAVVLGWNGFNVNSWSNITGWHMEIYDSLDAAVSNLSGNIASRLYSPSEVSVNTAYIPNSSDFNALVSIPVDIMLSSVGKYYISVIPTMNITGNGQTGIKSSVYKNMFPDGTDAWQVNPGGYFGFSQNKQAREANLAYRIDAQPVPEPSSLLVIGMGLVSFFAYRRRK